MAAAGLLASGAFLVLGDRPADAAFAVLLAAILARVLVLDVAERLDGEPASSSGDGSG